MHSPTAALSLFDANTPLTCEDMIGTWKGGGFPTGHPMDGLLEATGWYGKRFDSLDDVHPLVFGKPGKLFSVNPGLVPMSQAERLTPLFQNPLIAAAGKALIRCLVTSKPKARLRMVECRGQATATMLYDDLPIADHFRKLNDNTVLGLMDLRGSDPFFFTLTRV